LSVLDGPPVLEGRRTEVRVLDELLKTVRGGESRCLLLCGEPGIGKTALLEYLVENAADTAIVRAFGVESEMELAYASLHQLCAPLFDRLDRLAAPQRDALRVVFGLMTGPSPDPFLVGLAVLSLLSEAAEERPLLCVVDDAQWLDDASASTLAFVARRLLAEPMGMVLAAREPGEVLGHVPTLDLHGLGDPDARVLLDRSVHFVLDERIRARIVAETHGNPLALLELPRDLTSSELAGRIGVLDRASLPQRLEQNYIRRLEALGPEARQLLLLASAEPIGDPLLLWAAASRLGIDPAVVRSVGELGLVTIGARVIFRHPLVRSAAYRCASPEDRRAVHRALADLIDPESDPERRAWHLAAATAGLDEQVAVELERSAGRAQARGGLAAAAAFLQRAVELTEDRALRPERALAAAAANVQAGRVEVALALLSVAEAGPLEEHQRLRVDLQRAQIQMYTTYGTDAPRRLIEVAQYLAPLDPELARDTLLQAWFAAYIAGRVDGDGSLAHISSVARAAPHPAAGRRRSDVLLDGLAAMVTDGRVAAASQLEEAIRLFLADDCPPSELIRWGWLVSLGPSSLLWDDDSKDELFVRQLPTLRDAGSFAQLPFVLNSLCLFRVRCGDFPAARDAIAETRAVAEAIGSRLPPYGPMILAAHQGLEDSTKALVDTVMAEAGTAGQGMGVQVAGFTHAVLCNGLGRYAEAMDAARRACEDGTELFVAHLAAAELLEAASRTNQPDVAQEALERIEEASAITTTDSALGVLARSRAILSEGETAEELFQEAITRLGRSRLRPDLARARLLYGEWLRRQNRRSDARIQLRAAHDEFSTIGMMAFAERARGELAATGETVRKRTATTTYDLTEQERQIARLAREGMSNREIGARLFLSARTVEWHLRKVFGKLDISSRRELAGALRAAEAG